jgi:hypothetical protein
MKQLHTLVPFFRRASAQWDMPCKRMTTFASRPRA